MYLNVKDNCLHLLLRDLTGEGSSSLMYEYLKILPGDDGSFRVKLTRSQVRRLEKQLPKKTLKEKYE
jgi:hypothetical protein